MNWKSAIAAVGAIALVTGAANALSITNEDDRTQTIDVVIGEGDVTIGTYTLEPGDTQTGFCELGCVVRLSNGTEQLFDGNETVIIKDDDFLIAE